MNIFSSIRPARRLVIAGIRAAIFLVALNLSAYSFAQSSDVRGLVTNSKGEPVVGATVLVDGSALGTTTDVFGKFSLKLKPDDVIKVSFLGFDSQTVKAGSKSLLEITLAEASKQVEEVVVVGYGVQKKTSLTAAVSTLSGEEIKTMPVGNISNMMQGRMSGILASQGSGEPGDDYSEIFIRGRGTYGKNTAPLVIVDGVQGSLNELNPSSVENITVLKDAAAVAPYGMAGANGVILVTLKKGLQNDVKLSYDGYVGFQNPTRIIDRLNSYEYALARNQAEFNAGNNPAYTSRQVEGFRRTVYGLEGANPDAYPNSNVFEQYRNKNTPVTSHTFSIAGGGKMSKYFVSLGYYGQKGMWSTSNTHRFNLTANLEMQVTKSTQVSVKINGWNRVNNSPGSGQNIMNLTGIYLPTDITRFSNGLLGANWRNIVFEDQVLNGYTKDRNTSLTTQINIMQQLPVKGMSLTGIVAYSPSFTFYKRWMTPTSKYYHYNIDTDEYDEVTSEASRARLGESMRQQSAMNYQLHFNYMTSFGKHAFAFLAAVDISSGRWDVIGGEKTDYILDLDELSQGNPDKKYWGLTGTSARFRQIGIIGRLSYNYAWKYFVEVSARHDGHYFFAPGHRFGTFPAVSLSWRISEENFIKDKVKAVDNLKLRASYGISGNLAGSAFQYASTYDVHSLAAILDGVPQMGLSERSEANKLITWEKAAKYDVGIELKMWKGLLNLEADYFYEKRGNMLVNPNAIVPSEYGIGLAEQNNGEMMNQGVDMLLGTTIPITKDFHFSLSGNFTFARNKILKMYETEATYNDPKRRRTGRPLGTQFGLQAERLYQESDFDVSGNLLPIHPIPDVPVKPGDIKYVDTDHNGYINGDDETVIGRSVFPEIMYGFTPAFTYKGLEISAFFQGAGRSSVQLYEGVIAPFYSTEANPAAVPVRNAWTPENPDARYPRLTSGKSANNARRSSWWMWNGAYLRVKNIELAYNFPQKWLARNLRIEGLRIYVSLQNFFVLTDVPVIDPEVPSSGFARDYERSGQTRNYGEGVGYPQQKIYQLGVNLKF